MIEIDGSYLEGSGQLTRYALIFSTLTQQPVRIINIRQGREQPGLKPQHLNAIKLLKKICNAKTSEIEIGTKEITFTPNKIKGINTKIDIKTAGSITLLIQNVLLPLMFAKNPSKITIIGGTDVSWSPSSDYLKYVILPAFKPYTKNIQYEIKRRGFYPKGQGIAELKVSPKYSINNFEDFLKEIRKKEKPLNLVEQKISEISGISFASKELENAKVAERQNNAVKKLIPEAKIKNIYGETASTGTVITLFSSFIGSDSLGVKGKPAELIGKECAMELKKEIDSKACVDKHLADNLIPLLAILTGKIKTSEITEHTKTAIWVCEQFIKEKFTISNNLINCN